MLCWNSHEEISYAQGKRNPSKMVGIARGHQRADTLKPALSNSVKLSHTCGATQDGWVMVERSDRMWSTGKGNGIPLQCSCFENPVNSMKRQNDRILKEELPRSVGVSNVLPEINREITPERMKGWSQSKKSTQLWM